MNNEKGISLIEVVLSVAILMCIGGTLLPLYNQLQTTLLNKKLDLHASEIALNGARLVELYGVTEGVATIQQVEYKWAYNWGEICVSFQNLNEERIKCISK